MWSFIKSILACLFAMIIFLMMIVAFISMIAVFSNNGKSAKSIDKEGILYLDLNYEIREKNPESPFNISFSEIRYSNKLGLMEILSCIQAAKKDKKIKGIYLEMGVGINCGYATIEALRNELIDFKKSGKSVIAYGDVVSQKSYYLATVADKIYVNPIGGIDLRGFGGQVTFLKGMLDKLSIETQVYYAGKFKSATEPFRYKEMSAPNKEQVKAYLQDFATIIMSNISNSRNIPEEVLNESINNLTATIPETAVEKRIIDGALYYDQVLQKIKDMHKWDEKDKINFIKSNAYYDQIEKEDGKKNIAVIVAEGDIIDGKGDNESIGGDKFAKIIRDIREDENIKAVVLRVNSGGGSVLASDIIWRELQLLNAKKPVIASMGDVAASGGYYIAVGSRKIFAQPNTITGSIGVFGIIPNLQKFFNDKMGITFDEVELNDHAVMNLNKPLDAFEGNFMQGRIDKIYQDFIHLVAKGRFKEVAAIDSIAQGRVWSGVKAKELGLIDEIGGLNEAIKEAAKNADLKEYEIHVYPEEKDAFSSFMSDFSEKASSALINHAIIKEGLQDEMKYLRLLKKYKHYHGIKMEMPMEIEIN